MMGNKTTSSVWSYLAKNTKDACALACFESLWLISCLIGIKKIQRSAIFGQTNELVIENLVYISQIKKSSGSLQSFYKERFFECKACDWFRVSFVFVPIIEQEHTSIPVKYIFTIKYIFT